MIRSAFIYAIAGLVPQVCAYLLLPILSRSLTPAEFGIISLLEAVLFVSSAVLSFSVERGAQRYFFDFEGAEGKAVFSNALTMLAVTASVGLVLTAGVDGLGLRVASMPAFGLVAMTFAGCGLAVSSLALVYCQVTERPTSYLLVQAAKGLALLGTGFVAIARLHLGVRGYVISVMASYGVVGAVSVLLLPRMELRRVDRELIKNMVRFSAPFLPTVIGAWLLSMCGRFFLESYASLGDVGIYSFWYKLSLAYFLCSTAINTALGPVVYRALSRDAAGKVLTHALLPNLITIYGLGAIAFVLLSRELGGVMGGQRYALSTALFSCIVAGHFMSSVMGGGSDLLLGFFKLTKLQMMFFIGGGILSLLLNFILTPHIGIYGVVAATVLSLLSICVSHWSLLHRRRLPNFRLVQVLAWATAIAATGQLVARMESGIPGISRLCRFAVAAAAIAYALVVMVRLRSVESTVGGTVDESLDVEAPISIPVS